MTESDQPLLSQDPSVAPAWAALRKLTAARIALGRSGGSVRTTTVLDLRLDHARARDAVHAPFDAAALAAELKSDGLDSLVVSTRATDRESYLRRPDRGRRLDAASAQLLRERASPADLVLIISDGLSATAAHRHARPTVVALHARMLALGWTVAPLIIAPFGRVKLQDEIGEIIGARHALMLLGERPGLGAPDSLGAYLTHAPRADRTDADRNCVSNIRPAGIPPEQAAAKLARLLEASARLGGSGVRLKDRDDSSPPPALP